VLDIKTSLYGFIYRCYSPGLGRFLRRDPISEMGGVHLYAFLGNNPVSRKEFIGLTEYSGWGSYIDIYILINGGKPSSGRFSSFNAQTDSIVFVNSSGQSTSELLFLATLVSAGLAKEGCTEAAQHFLYWVNPQGTKPDLQPSLFQNKLSDHLQDVRSEAGKDCNAGTGSLQFDTSKKGDCIFLLLGDYSIGYTKTPASGNNVLVTFTVDDPYDFSRGADAAKTVNGIKIGIEDNVWLDLKGRNEGYGVDFKRSTSWTETVPCCPEPPPSNSGGGSRQ